MRIDALPPPAPQREEPSEREQERRRNAWGGSGAHGAADALLRSRAHELESGLTLPAPVHACDADGVRPLGFELADHGADVRVALTFGPALELRLAF